MRISDKALGGERLGRHSAIGLARPRLIPVHDDKMIFKWRKEPLVGDAARAGSAHEEEQHWIVRVLAANGNPLVAAVQGHLLQGSDAAWQWLAVASHYRGRGSTRLRTDCDTTK